MKLVNVIFGFVIFSIITSILFGSVGKMMDANNIGGSSTVNDLSGDYEVFYEQIEDSNSTSRKILGQTEQGAASSEDVEVSLIEGALSGGRLSINFFLNFNKILSTSIGDLNDDGTAIIDPKIIIGIFALIVVFFAFVIIHFIWRAKTET